jgi:hypothetical protein
MSFPVRLFKGSALSAPLRRYFSNRRKRPSRSDSAGSGRLKRQQQQRENQEADPFSPASLRYRNQQNDSSISDNAFSTSGVRYTTFLVLGIVPLVVFGIVVEMTPHLRVQLEETIDSVQSYVSGSSKEENHTKPKDMEADTKSDTA